MDKDAVIDQGTQAASSVGSVIGEEIGKIIKSVIGQTTGSATTDPISSNSLGADNVADLKKKDDEFKKKSEIEWFQKYNAIYENAASRARQEKEQLAKANEEQLEERKKLEELQEARARGNFVNRSIEQTKAENKNFGAE